MPSQSVHAFAEKVALITDGASPIGRAVAMQLALLGSYVIVAVPKTSEEDKRALEELKLLGTLAHSVEGEISTVEGAKKLIAEVENIYGRLDLLVNCLKFKPDCEFAETTEEIFSQTFDVNLKSAFFVTQEALRLMKPRPKPKIVNVLSACDTMDTKQNVAFASVNQALKGFTESLSKNLPKNFRVNAVAVSEKENEKAKHENLDAELFRVKTGTDEDDVARAIIYLLSSEAVGLTGQILKIE